VFVEAFFILCTVFCFIFWLCEPCVPSSLTQRSSPPWLSKDEKVKFSFKVFDLNQDGFIDKYELSTLVSDLLNERRDGFELTPTQIQDMCEETVRELDLDKNEKIDFEEFSQMVQCKPGYVIYTWHQWFSLSLLSSLSLSLSSSDPYPRNVVSFSSRVLDPEFCFCFFIF